MLKCVLQRPCWPFCTLVPQLQTCWDVIIQFSDEKGRCTSDCSRCEAPREGDTAGAPEPSGLSQEAPFCSALIANEAALFQDGSSTGL